jgi:hypothetical protein
MRRRQGGLTALLAAALLASCSGEPVRSGPLQLISTPSGPDTRVTLHADSGLKVNARLAPALELGDGSVLRFDAGRRTPDSAYFAEPPSALWAGRHRSAHGTLHASVCYEHERVCRRLTVKI